MTMVFNRVGPYEILEPIGSGGMAQVFLSLDTRSQQRVALRLVPVGRDREARDILQAERLGARLQHEFSNVCQLVPRVYEHGELPDYLYVAMEYLDGENLSDVIGRGQVQPDRAVSIALELCGFLEAAHAFEVTVEGRPLRSLLHGDLKPRNIRVTSNGRIRVLDFGIAKALSLSRKVTRNDFGSLAYLSPERIESGGPYDGKADIYSLGVMLYEMLCGQVPFYSSEGHWQTALMHMTMEPLLPREINPAIPEPVEAAVLKALTKDPEKRPDANELRQEILKALEFDPDLPATGNFKAIINERLGSEAEVPTAHFIKEENPTDEDWTKIEKIFYSALEYEPDKRSAFLDEACCGDEALRKKVEALIKADEKAEEKSFLNSPLGNKE